MIDQVNSQFTFVVKKTNELSEEEIDEIADMSRDARAEATT